MKQKTIEKLEKETQRPGFWQEKDKAVEVSTELNKLKEQTELFNSLDRELADIVNLDELGEKEEDLEKEIEKFEKRIKKEEL